MIQWICYFVIQFIAFVWVFKTLIDIRDEIKDTKRIAMQTNRDANDAYDSANFACLRLKDLNEEIERISIDTSLIVKRFNNIAEEQNKKEQAFKNKHVDKAVSDIQAMLSEIYPKHWDYKYDMKNHKHIFVVHNFEESSTYVSDIRTILYRAYGVVWRVSYNPIDMSHEFIICEHT